MTDINQKFVHSSNYTDRTSNLIMTDVNAKFVYYTEWKKEGTDTIFYNGNIKITSNLHCSNLYCSNLETYKLKVLTELNACDATLKITDKSIKTQGKVELSNPNAIDEYAIINPYFDRLTKRVVFGPDNTGNLVAKELISNTTINYNPIYIKQSSSYYYGEVFDNTGLLYIYDKNIPINPLDTVSCSFSFWCNMDNQLYTTSIINNYDYVSCQIFKIDQDKINSLNFDRRRIRILFIAVKNVFGNIVYTIDIEYGGKKGYFLPTKQELRHSQKVNSNLTWLTELRQSALLNGRLDLYDKLGSCGLHTTELKSIIISLEEV
jgi:hypothetical protein